MEEMKMKLMSLALACTLAFSAPVVAGEKPGHAHELRPLHGGVVAEARGMEFELVLKPDAIAVYVRDHGKTVTTPGGTGKITILNGLEKVEAALAPVGGDRLEAEGRFSVIPGTRLVALVALQGKPPVNVRFAIR